MKKINSFLLSCETLFNFLHNINDVGILMSLIIYTKEIFYKH